MKHALTLAAGLTLFGAPDEPDTPQEFGAVTWGRVLEPALAQSAETHKPVLLLFQEVPG